MKSRLLYSGPDITPLPAMSWQILPILLLVCFRFISGVFIRLITVRAILFAV